MAQLVKNPPARWETGFDPWVGKIEKRKAGEEKGYPLQYSGLENSIVAKSQSGLSDFHFH